LFYVNNTLTRPTKRKVARKDAAAAAAVVVVVVVVRALATGGKLETARERSFPEAEVRRRVRVLHGSDFTLATEMARSVS